MNFEEQYRQVVDGIFSENIPGFHIARDFCLGEGKRIRPMLLLDATKKWGGDMEKATRAAIAVELLHHYFLIHDDLMDRDVLRRGHPTVYASCHKEYGVEKGEGIAIALGDYLVNESVKIITEVDAKAALFFCTTIQITIRGQLSEYITNAHWSLQEIEDFYAEKTAAYTFTLPLQIADALSSSKERKELIKDASQHLGIAFQYRDDLMEFQGKKKRDEKGERDDFSRGKMTIINRVLLDCLSEDEQKSLLSIWEKGMTINEVSIWRARAEEKGVIQTIENMISEHLQKATLFIESLDLKDTTSFQVVVKYIK